MLQFMMTALRASYRRGNKMARNPQMTKLKKQQFRRRRGNFKPLSNSGTIDEVYVDPKLEQFWSARVGTGSSVDRAHIPKDQRGYFEYRDHAKVNPNQAWLDVIFPGVQVPKLHAAAIEQQIRFMQPEDCTPKDCILLEQTKTGKVWLFWATGQKCYWFVQQVFSQVRVSCTYGSATIAKEIFFKYGIEAIPWKKREQFTIHDT